MKYELFCDYETGDSESHYDEKEVSLGIVCSSYEVAAKALEELKEHHNLVEMADRIWKRSDHEAALKTLLAKPYCVKEYYQYSVNVLVNEGGERRVTTLPYHGYFDRLHTLYAKPLEDNDPLRLTFH